MAPIAALPLVPPTVPVQTWGRAMAGGYVALGPFVLAVVGAIILGLALARAYGWALQRHHDRESVQHLHREVEALLRDPLMTMQARRRIRRRADH